MSLKPKQLKFIDEYMVDGNGSQAAIRAGYPPRSARKQAAENLTKPDIQEEISRRQAKLSERTQVTAQKVIEEYARIAFSEIGDVLDFSGTDPRLKPANEIPKDARRAISSVKVRRYVEGHGDDAKTVELVEFKLWPKTEALRDLAKHLGLMKESVEVSHFGTVALAIVEDDNWYGNDAHAKAAAAALAPTAGAAVPEPVQGGGVRPPVGENGNGPANGHARPR